MLIELPLTVKIIPLLLGALVAIMPIKPIAYHEIPDTNWYQGEVGYYSWEGKIFDDPSQFGINNGRVSKLKIKKGNKVVVNYDRGWDIPVDEDTAKVVNDILKEFPVK